MLASRGTVINVPNALRAKVGGGQALNGDAIAKAEEALKALSANFAQWLADEVVRLDAARAAVREGGRTPAATETLYFRAHDLKGLGATYDFPLVGAIAGSLCKLLDEPAKRPSAPQVLIDAHVDAIRLCVRQEMREVNHPAGALLLAELDARVSAHVG